MGPEQVHQGPFGPVGIVFRDLEQGVPEGGGVFFEKIREDRVPEGIVHHAVQFVPQEVGAPLAVGDLDRRVLPHLAQEERVLLLFPGSPADLPDEIVRQFVGHVEPPAGRTEAQPFPHDPVLTRDEPPEGRSLLVDGGQDLHVPPAGVVVGEVPEHVPVVIGRSLSLIGAGGRIAAVFVEIHAVVAGVVEDAVQKDAHPRRGGFFAEFFEVLLASQHGIHFAVVGCVIPVIGVRRKDRIEIDRPDAEGAEIGDLCRDPPEIPAVEIVVGHVPARQHGLKGDLAEIGHQAPSGDLFSLPLEGEAVREDLVGDPVAEPGGRLRLPVIHREAERHVIVVGEDPFPAAVFLPGAVKGLRDLRPDAEDIMVKARLPQVQFHPVEIPGAFPLLPPQGEAPHLLLVVTPEEQLDRQRRHAAADRKAQDDPPSGRRGAEGSFAVLFPGVVIEQKLGIHRVRPFLRGCPAPVPRPGWPCRNGYTRSTAPGPDVRSRG